MGLSLCLLVLTSLAWRGLSIRQSPAPQPSGPMPDLFGPEASQAELERTCGTCHALPTPDLFPKHQWPREVRRGFQFLEKGQARSPSNTSSFARIVSYYYHRAPDELAIVELTPPSSSGPVRFEVTGYRLPGGSRPPGIAYVRFVQLSDARKLDVLACDMINGLILLLKPYEPEAELRVVTDAVPHPAHAEVADLDGDGVKDLLVANLGRELPTDERVGSVVWVRGRPDGSFHRPVTLAGDLGRVADVQAADIDGDGDRDLIVAEFGWQDTGSIRLLENRTTDAERPAFVLTTVDPRHGTIHVPVDDLDGDARPDFVALISQEHETIVAFLNAGGFRFRPEVIYTAPHPAYGSSGIQLVDLDGDGDRDVLMTNGDSLDSQLLRPDHGVQWLENRGEYPFRYHHLATLHGAQRAVAADIDGDGDLDVVASSFLPGDHYRKLCRERGLDAVIALEQVTPGRFVRHRIEGVTCDHAACDLGDFDADGKADLLVGNFLMTTGDAQDEDRHGVYGLDVRRNLGRP